MYNQFAVSAHAPEAILGSMPADTPQQVYRFAEARERREKGLRWKSTQSLYASRVLGIVLTQ